eukprot:comp23860_c0_seq1/m.41749 comp23860_c0_seq1/g.41749  ORF comp23860_c0_seq1/g.41749 comp23860_c0_seq1/m.41749 type:complete len:1713 (-) comp23860_c0_seq1:397-5535(-)
MTRLHIVNVFVLSFLLILPFIPSVLSSSTRQAHHLFYRQTYQTSLWSDWGPCSVPCDGAGTKSRVCLGGGSCPGFASDDCNNGACGTDPCGTGKHNCHAQTNCTNVNNYPTCTCKTGYEGNGQNCTATDMCASKTHQCDPQATCTFTGKNYTCKCNVGYGGSGFTCTDINECAGTSHTCHQFATCQDTNGSYVCYCNRGWKGNGTTCENANECEDPELNTCGGETDCIDTDGSFLCACTPGYAQQNGSCQARFADVNECTMGLHTCCNSAICTNTPGSFKCECKPGYSGNGNVCQACKVVANCAGPVQCPRLYDTQCPMCNAGYYLDESYEADLCRPCTDVSRCDQVQGCDGKVNYKCLSCKQGYVNETSFCNGGCHMVNHCVKFGACDAANPTAGRCDMCEGGYYLVKGDSTKSDACVACPDVFSCSVAATCTGPTDSVCPQCVDGYNKTDKGQCVDRDECTMKIHNCHASANCSNILGSFICFCNRGYQGNGLQCTDINECLYPVCDDKSVCVNTKGSFTCACNTGYLAINNKCKDLDECESGKHTCTNGTICLNTIGSFTCKCGPGYQGQNGNCSNINECLFGLHHCGLHSKCTDNIGSFTCNCVAGYEGNGFNCTNVDECAIATPCDPSALCIDSEGSFSCKCGPGYFNKYGPYCSECNPIPACQGPVTCTNSTDSTCGSCPPGYYAGTVNSGFGCIRCSNVSNCQDFSGCDGKTDYVCTTCKAGFKDPPSHCANACHPIQFCATVPLCSSDAPKNSNCTECQAGFFRDPRTDAPDLCLPCTPIEHCLQQPTCMTVNSSRCSNCSVGWTVSENAASCDDINECAYATKPCNGTGSECVNTPGSFFCRCLPGFSGDGKNCTDRDECTEGTHRCDRPATCTNTIGSYTCKCNVGYTGDGTLCSDINECLANPCSVTARCDNTLGSFTCACNEGFTGDGVICRNMMCTDNRVDIVQVLDASGSIGKEDFNYVGQYVTNFAHDTEIGEDMWHEAVIMYSDCTYMFNIVELLSPDSSNKSKVEEAGQTVIKKYAGGTTCTGNAINRAGAMLLDEKGRKVAKAMILVTDGNPNSGLDSVEEARKLLKQGVRNIVVGVGKEFRADNRALQEIAGLDQNPPGALLAIQQYDELKRAVTGVLLQTLCPAPEPNVTELCSVCDPVAICEEELTVTGDVLCTCPTGYAGDGRYCEKAVGFVPPNPEVAKQERPVTLENTYAVVQPAVLKTGDIQQTLDITQSNCGMYSCNVFISWSGPSIYVYRNTSLTFPAPAPNTTAGAQPRARAATQPGSYLFGFGQLMGTSLHNFWCDNVDFGSLVGPLMYRPTGSQILSRHGNDDVITVDQNAKTVLVSGTNQSAYYFAPIIDPSQDVVCTVNVSAPDTVDFSVFFVPGTQQEAKGGSALYNTSIYTCAATKVEGEAAWASGAADYHPAAGAGGVGSDPTSLLAYRNNASFVALGMYVSYCYPLPSSNQTNQTVPSNGTTNGTAAAPNATNSVAPSPSGVNNRTVGNFTGNGTINGTFPNVTVTVPEINRTGFVGGSVVVFFDHWITGEISVFVQAKNNANKKGWNEALKVEGSVDGNVWKSLGVLGTSNITNDTEDTIDVHPLRYHAKGCYLLLRLTDVTCVVYNSTKSANGIRVVGVQSATQCCYDPKTAALESDGTMDGASTGLGSTGSSSGSSNEIPPGAITAIILVVSGLLFVTYLVGVNKWSKKMIGQ